MSFRDDIEKAVEAMKKEWRLFDPVAMERHLGVALVANQVSSPTDAFSSVELSVYLRTDDHGTPEYIGVEYQRHLGGAAQFDDLAVVDVEPELRQVWTVKR